MIEGWGQVPISPLIVMWELLNPPLTRSPFIWRNPKSDRTDMPFRAVIMSMIALIVCVARLMIPGVPLSFTWLRFLRQNASRDFRGRLTLEFPLFVVTGSYLIFFLFFGYLTLLITFLTLRTSFGFNLHIPVLIWSNAILSFVMSVLALIGKNSLRWRLAGSAATVSFAWFVVGFTIFAVGQAGGWVV
jgi:hypothetical protein